MDDLLQARRITKRFGGVAALRDADLTVRAGEVLGLVGENGAGKSTLMKVLAGVHPAGSYDGELLLDGVPVAFGSVREAERAGIVLLPQELHIAPELSIAENMFVGRMPRRRGTVDRIALHEAAARWLRFFEIELSPELPARMLAPSEQRLALIAAALSSDARVLVLDEPTAALTDAEADRLFGHLARLAQRGVGIVFITHRLDEIDRVAQRIVVMRNGEVVERFDGDAPSRRELVRAMLGRHLGERARRRTDRPRGPRRLHVSALDVADPQVPGKLRVRGASMSVHGGEIVGLYGLVGAGRTELLLALFGAWPGRVAGEVLVDERPVARGSAREAMRDGLALLSEDRKATGVLPGQTVHANLSAASLGRVSRAAVIDRAREIERNRDLIERLDVRPPLLGALIGHLSGGNQQKVLLGRCLATAPRVLLLDEPSLGVDVGSRFQIYEHIRALADTGVAILLVSSDVEEVHQECDRILVMYKGAIAGEFPGSCDRHDLLAAATGGNA